MLSFFIRVLDFHLRELESICLTLFVFTLTFLKDKASKGFNVLAHSKSRSAQDVFSPSILSPKSHAYYTVRYGSFLPSFS